MSRLYASLLLFVALASRARADDDEPIDPNCVYGTRCDSTETYRQIILAHAVLMCWTFLFAAPIGVFIARYARDKLWFRPHSLTMGLAAGVPFIAAWVLGYLSVTPDNFTSPHTIIGLTILLLFLVQVILGITSHIVYLSKKSKDEEIRRPWHNHIHLWLGRIILLFALANIPIGMDTYGSPIGVFIGFAVWAFILLATFVVFEWRLNQAKRVVASKISA